MNKLFYIISTVLATIVLLMSCHEASNFNEVTIGKQVWMSKNLNVDRFRNGDIILEVKTEKEWIEAGEKRQPAWSYYDNDSINGEIYGKLYNWYAVIDERGLAPEGWRVPSIEDIVQLNEHVFGLRAEVLNREGYVGTKLKSKEKWYGVNNIDGNGIDLCDFKGLPGGSREPNSCGFLNLETYGFWWTSTKKEFEFPLGYNFALHWRNNDLLLDWSAARAGYSVRCLKE